MAIGIGGWGLQIVALGLAPLTVVQPALAAGLLLLMYLGVRLLGEHVGPPGAGGGRRRSWAGSRCSRSARRDRATEVTSRTALAVALGVLVVAAVAPYALRMLGTAGGLVLVISAGAADAIAGVAAKLISDELSRGRLLVALAWAVLAGAAVLLGLLSETTALQRLPATRVAPPVLVLQVTVPVLLAPLVFGESWGATPLGGGLIVAGLAVVARRDRRAGRVGRERGLRRRPATSSTRAAAAGSAAKERSGSRRCASARSSAGGEFARGRRATSARPKRAEGLVVGPDVGPAPAVGDRRAAADERLEHRQARRRVDERVGGGQQIAPCAR